MDPRSAEHHYDHQQSFAQLTSLVRKASPMLPETDWSHPTDLYREVGDRMIAELTLPGAERAQRRTDAARDYS
jgi:hypothetical protein